MTENRLKLLLTIADKLSDTELTKLAYEKLSLSELQAVKTADWKDWSGSGDRILEALKGAKDALLNHTGTPGAGPLTAAGETVGAMPGIATDLFNKVKGEHKGLALGAGGALGLAATLYLGHKALQHMFGDTEDEPDNIRLASADLTPSTRARLDKLAQDPGIGVACYILAKHGLL